MTPAGAMEQKTARPGLALEGGSWLLGGERPWMSAPLSIVLLIASLVHLFLHVYNRYLLCITDSPLKGVIHQAWLTLSVLIPTVLVVVFADWPPLHAALIWSPDSALEKSLFLVMVALMLFLLLRSLAWLFDRFLPEIPRHLIGESVHKPQMPTIPPRLPRGLRRFETTGDLVVIERDLSIPGLAPAFEGITIAQISDVHFSLGHEMENYFDAVRGIVSRLDPDIVVFTGDFVDHRRNIVRSVEYHETFRGRLATFCVLGNHDYWTRADRIQQSLRRTHIRWLGGGERRTLKRGGRRLIFTGTDAPWTENSPDLRRAVRRGTGDAVVLLSHTPDNAPRAARYGASLVLSGHNHGGQV